ncbi:MULTISPECIES: hypothetical protein [Pseudovibrio]|uniref:hypothetical protein n=1 Tax=Stappiaceae TaxID=2821832 RepID=UPI0023652904|nr:MULTISPECIES: hypothetical protein [Pseudovibrio]MDD7911405.1 hypothetical protein [Pseudovibrio exalbescens]MDX5592908.1 hypothetical protein [Pseudovibrio sp. SPO723]
MSNTGEKIEGKKTKHADKDAPLTALKQVGWFILLWCLGISVVGIISYGIRAVIL